LATPTRPVRFFPIPWVRVGQYRPRHPMHLAQIRSSMSRRKLIIGCGYLGRRVARRWIEGGDIVSALTRSSAHAEEFARSGIQPIIGDVTDASSLARLEPADVLLWAVGLDRASGRSQRDVYVDGLANVLRSPAGRSAKVHYISSTSVYGQDAGEFVDESSECRPLAENGKVCLEAEQTLHRANPAAITLRLAGIYGPGRLLARLAQLREERPFEGNPEAWLNLIHVDDAVAALLACERRGRDGETYLVCDDAPQRRRAYYQLLAWLSGTPAPRFSEPTEALPPSLNKRCLNRRLRAELSVALHYPTMNEGLPAALLDELDRTVA
jgi:nucleoside-diphosphate-sugar epimerase